MPKVSVKKPRKVRVKKPKTVWVIMGGVGGGMFLGSALGTNPFCWKISEKNARHFALKEFADDIAKVAGGTVEARVV